MSFFKPPSIEEGIRIPFLDKIVHFCMYFGFSLMLWIDLWRARKSLSLLKRGWYIAFLLPVLISGVIELLQEYCTTFRGGEWLDFCANSLGALTASTVTYLFLKRRLLK